LSQHLHVSLYLACYLPPSVAQPAQLPVTTSRPAASRLQMNNESCWWQGVILYGEPGTGKTLLAKAVANSTSATFLRVVGSELIQKYLGDGPKLVRELFRVAEELAPTIVFIGQRVSWSADVHSLHQSCTIA